MDDEVLSPAAAATEVLGRLIDDAHLAAADQIADLVANHVAALAFSEPVLYLADYEQRMLMPLPGHHVPVREPLLIEGTLGGRAFRSESVLEADVPDGGCRVWLPLLDGTARLGVMEIAVGELNEHVEQACRQLAGLVAELIVAKNMYGDHYKMIRRRATMTLAAEMQWNLLPPLTFTSRNLTISGMLEPSYSIAGDTFDYAYDDETIRLAIIDAMGHGFEATMMAAVAVNAYRHGRREGLSIADTFASVDAALAEHFHEDQFATGQVAELDARTGVLRWISAGHPPPILIRDGRAVGALTCAPTLPLGLGGDIAEVADEQLEPGDAVLLYTDGVTEARSHEGEFFGSYRLADFVGRATAAGLAPHETLRRLTHALLDHQEGTLQDDATMLLVQWRGRQPLTD